MSGLVFVTMAGHGGEDSGAANPYHPWLPEKAINLMIDAEFSRLAVLNGHSAYRLRTGDIKVSLNEIAPKAIQVNANAVFEFHCDSVTDQNARGCHAIILPGTPGENVGMRLVSYIEAQTGIPALGVKDHFWGTSPTPIYTRDVERFGQLANRIHSMTENGFISNAIDESILSSAAGRTEIAWSHLAGVHDYYGLPLPIVSGGGSSVGVAGLLAMIVAVGALGFTYKMVSDNKQSEKGGKRYV